MKFLYPFSAVLLTAVLIGACERSPITEPTEPVVDVTVSGRAVLAVGTTAQFSASAADAAGNQLTGRSVEWSSSDSEVASVSPTGLVTGHQPGSVTISAEVDGVTGRADLTVEPVSVAAVQASLSSLVIEIGSSAPLSAVALDEDGNPLDDREITWSSTATGIARVDAGGVVTAHASGEAAIIAAAGGRADTVMVEVPPAAGLYLRIESPVPVAEYVIGIDGGAFGDVIRAELYSVPGDSSHTARIPLSVPQRSGYRVRVLARTLSGGPERSVNLAMASGVAQGVSVVAGERTDLNFQLVPTPEPTVSAPDTVSTRSDITIVWTYEDPTDALQIKAHQRAMGELSYFDGSGWKAADVSAEIVAPHVYRYTARFSAPADPGEVRYLMYSSTFANLRDISTLLDLTTEWVHPPAAAMGDLPVIVVR